jgi:hypothetical protein
MKMPVIEATAWYSESTVRSSSGPPPARRRSEAPGSEASSGLGARPDRLDDRGIAVDQGDGGGHPPAGGDAGTLQDQRDARRLLVHVRLAPEGARAEIVAVVARVDDERILGEAARVQGRQDPADVVVEVGDHAVVGGDRGADVLLVTEVVLVVLDLAQLP